MVHTCITLVLDLHQCTNVQVHLVNWQDMQDSDDDVTNAKYLQQMLVGAEAPSEWITNRIHCCDQGDILDR